MIKQIVLEFKKAMLPKFAKGTELPVSTLLAFCTRYSIKLYQSPKCMQSFLYARREFEPRCHTIQDVRHYSKSM